MCKCNDQYHLSCICYYSCRVQTNFWTTIQSFSTGLPLSSVSICQKGMRYNSSLLSTLIITRKVIKKLCMSLLLKCFAKTVFELAWFVTFYLFCPCGLVKLSLKFNSTCLRLGSVLWSASVPFLVCKTYGLIGYMRLVVREHTG